MDSATVGGPGVVQRGRLSEILVHADPWDSWFGLMGHDVVDIHAVDVVYGRCTCGWKNSRLHSVPTSRMEVAEVYFAAVGRSIRSAVPETGWELDLGELGPAYVREPRSQTGILGSDTVIVLGVPALYDVSPAEVAGEATTDTGTESREEDYLFHLALEELDEVSEIALEEDLPEPSSRCL